MVFHTPQRRVNYPTLKLNNVNIERVSQFNILGVILASSLKWDKHVAHVSLKISRVIGVLYRLKHVFPRDVLLTLYNALILPHLSHCILVWGSRIDGNHRLLLPQKKAVRIITNQDYFSNNEFSGVLTQNNSNLSILNLNCQSVDAKFDKLQIFLRCINNDLNPIHVITLQESWGTANVDMKHFNLPDYAMLYDDSRLSKHGGLITYVHGSFAVDRLDIEEYYQKSTVFESMILKIHKKLRFINNTLLETSIVAHLILSMSFLFSFKNSLYFLVNYRQIPTKHIFVETLTLIFQK